jgi:hypothetical protein
MGLEALEPIERKTSLSEGTVCPANKTGMHTFDSFILESTTQDNEQFKNMVTTLSEAVEDDTLVKLVVAMSHRKYAVVCSACGKVAATCEPG